MPEIKAVTRSEVFSSTQQTGCSYYSSRFPGLEEINHCDASKIPTVIYYDRSGKVRAVGGEAMIADISYIAEDESWVKAEW